MVSLPVDGEGRDRELPIRNSIREIEDRAFAFPCV